MSGIDLNKFARALSKPGIDPRLWISHGIVGRLDDAGKLDSDDGDDPKKFVATDPKAGPLVDVVLTPSGDQIKARLGSGTQKGRETCVLTPIRGGCQVVVGVPDGDLNNYPAIVQRFSFGGDAEQALPSKWDNDSFLVHVGDKPLKLVNGKSGFIVWDADGGLTIRTPGGLVFQLSADGFFNILDGATNSIWSDDTGIQILTAQGAIAKFGDKISLYSPGAMEINAASISLTSGGTIAGVAAPAQSQLIKYDAAFIAALTTLISTISALPAPVAGSAIGTALTTFAASLPASMTLTFKAQ